MQPCDTKLNCISVVLIFRDIEDSLATLSEGNLNHASGNDGSGKRGAEEVDVLVNGVALNGSCKHYYRGYDAVCVTYGR